MSSRKTAGRHAASFHTADPGRDYEFVLDLRETADDGGVAEAFLASATPNPTQRERRREPHGDAHS